VAEIVEQTILRGQVIPRLLISDSRYAPENLEYGPLDSK
jgi:hypothetical protein